MTREGKVYCAAVPDTFSRRIVGWSINSRQGTDPISNALEMAIRNRRPNMAAWVHSDHGVTSTSWGCAGQIRSAGLMPASGNVNGGLDNAI